MTPTYSQLIDDVNALALKNGFDKVKDKYTKELSDSILEAIDQILRISTIMQIYGDNLTEGVEYEFNPDTKLSKDTIMSVYAQTDDMIEQNIMMSLIKDILDEEESVILNNLIESYNYNPDNEFIEIVRKTDLTTLVKKGSPILGIIALIKNGINLIEAIRDIIKEFGLDPSKKEIRETIDTPYEIQNFLTDFNELLLSKLSSGNSFFITQQSLSLN